MRYALLVCNDETEEFSAEAAEARFDAYTVFQDQLTARGMLVSRVRLRPTATATTVRVRSGTLVIADGPFAETKEQIAGFFIVECVDLDEAIGLAAQIPGAQHGTVEVRPVWAM